MLLLAIGMKYSNSMKPQVVFLLIILITSCARIDSSRIAPGYVEAFSSIKQLLLGFENNISPEVINNIPYASMLVKIGNGPTALMILESVSIPPPPDRRCGAL